MTTLVVLCEDCAFFSETPLNVNDIVSTASSNVVGSQCISIVDMVRFLLRTGRGRMDMAVFDILHRIKTVN